MTNDAPDSEETEGAVKMPGGRLDGTPSQGHESVGCQLRRRRLAARRCEPLPDGRRDPWTCRGPNAPARTENISAWRRALGHLRDHGLVGLPPAAVREALGDEESAA